MNVGGKLFGNTVLAQNRVKIEGGGKSSPHSIFNAMKAHCFFFSSKLCVTIQRTLVSKIVRGNTVVIGFIESLNSFVKNFDNYGR